MAACQAAYETLDALRKLSSFKPFTGWFAGRVMQSVRKLEAEILSGEISAEEVMKKRVQRAAVLDVLEMLKREHSAAQSVLDQMQKQEAVAKQMRAVPPSLDEMPVPDLAAATEVTVAGLTDEFAKQFSIWGARDSETQTTIPS